MASTVRNDLGPRQQLHFPIVGVIAFRPWGSEGFSDSIAGKGRRSSAAKKQDYQETRLKFGMRSK